MKNYFIILLFLLVMASPAYAAVQVKGEVPKVEPLQAPAQGVSPNYKGNINYIDPRSQIPSVTPDGSGAQEPSAEVTGSAKPSSGSHLFFWMLGAVVLWAAIAGTRSLLKNKKNE